MIKNFIKQIPFLYDFAVFLRGIYTTKDIFCKSMKINKINRGVRLRKHIKGTNNYMEIGENSSLRNAGIRVVGSNNRIIFGSNCMVGNNCSFWMEGNNITIIIGNNTTFTHSVHFCDQEDNTTITVGEDCMFSNTIIVRTSDSHPIYDLSTQKRINPAKNVVIGNHVWVAPNTKIMKGAKIGDNSIVGSNTMITKEIPNNCLVVGSPCKVVKTNISWTREKIF